MNALARAADTVTDAAGHSGMKNDNFKDGEMRLTVGLALTLAIMTCGAQARDMQSIEHSGELKVGVPGDYAPLANCRAMTWTWPAISGARSASR